MHLDINTNDKNLIVKFVGELDHHSTESARRKIDQYYIDKELNNIILDLSQLSFMDSSGIGLIMGRYKNVLEKKGKLILISNNKSVVRILQMSGLLKIIDLYSSMELALEKIGRGDN